MLPVKLALIEDHILLRTTLKTAITFKAPHIKIVAELSSDHDALQRIPQINPEIILIGASLNGGNSLDISHRLFQVVPHLKMIAITDKQNDPLLLPFLKLGVLGWISREATLENLIEAIDMVAKGQPYMNISTATQIAMQRIGGTEETPLSLLSSREAQVLMQVAQGFAVIEIAKNLAMNPKTVCSYRYRIFQKLNIKNDAELVHLAFHWGLIDRCHAHSKI